MKVRLRPSICTSTSSRPAGVYGGVALLGGAVVGVLWLSFAVKLYNFSLHGRAMHGRAGAERRVRIFWGLRRSSVLLGGKLRWFYSPTKLLYVNTAKLLY